MHIQDNRPFSVVVQSQPDSRVTLVREKWLTISGALELDEHGWLVVSTGREWNRGAIAVISYRNISGRVNCVLIAWQGDRISVFQPAALVSSSSFGA
jgi:hypothetical protein